jgi:AcrR family transcriptional regulator
MNFNTRENILRVTSGLLVSRGYHGTSTRDIANAVGIRQPSLFHHFESKRAILAELLDLDLKPAAARARHFARLPGPAAPRLYAYILADYRALAESPYDVRSLYTSDLLNDPDFAEYEARLAEFVGDLQSMVEQGVRLTEFRDVRPAHGQQAVAGMFYAALWAPRWLSVDETAGWPEASAEIILRGLLRRPSQFPQIKQAGARLLAEVSANGASA